MIKNKNEYTFTYEQRLILQNCWEFRHMSVAKIARYLNRSPTFIERELQRGDILYDGELRPQKVAFMAANRAKARYNAQFAQDFVDKYQLTRLEHNHFTPALKYLLEHRLSQGLTPEQIVQLYADEVPITARTIRRYIVKGYITVVLV